MLLQRQILLASVLKEMRDKIRSSSTKSEDEAVSDPKVNKPLSQGALEEASLEREGDRLRERKFGSRDGSGSQG